MRLRPYQQELVTNAIAELSNGSRSTLAVMPTGTGKTVCFSEVIRRWVELHPHSRALVVAHREELIFQAGDKYKSVTGETADIEMGDFRAQRHGLLTESSVIVSSVQTQNAGSSCKLCDGGKTVVEDEFGNARKCRNCLDGVVRRMQRFDPDEFGLLVIDEAHHATAETYRRIINFYGRNPNLRILGVTATPDRADEEALGKVFDSVAFEYGIVEAINDGWLVPISQEWIVCENLDFSRCRTTAGDLNGADLARVLEEEEALHEVTSPTVEIAGDKATLVFAASVAHAELMSEIFNRHRPGSSICIHGATPTDERRRMLAEYADGKYQFLCGCGVFLEGFDEPRIEVVAMARPTKSRALYAQAIGRGTRPVNPPLQATPEERRAAIAASRKPGLLVLDFVGNSGRHKLISTADILGGEYEDHIVERAIKESKKKTGPVDMLELLAETQQEVSEEARKKREKIIAASKFTRHTISPFDVFEVTPAREPGWHKGRKPSEKMVAALTKFGIESKDLSFCQAKQLLDQAITRVENGLCSYKQAKILSKYGQPTNVGFKEASAIIDAIARNNWKPIERVMV